MKGFIHVYTGDGKGKTTAAIGLTVRAIGNGLKVLFVQFMKDAHTGELKILEKFPELVDIYCCSTGFIYDRPDKSQIEIVEKCLKDIEEKLKKNDYDMIVFDELSVAINTGVLSRSDAERLIQLKSENTEVIITGRGAPQWLIEKADLVTEMKKLKHYFDRGIKARKGIEY